MYFSSRTKVASMMKQALIPELVRLGYTDIPGTPRLVMKKRSPEELQKIEENVHKKIRGPQVKAERFVNKGLNKVPMSPEMKRKARLAYKIPMRHPETGLYNLLYGKGIPVPPGTSEAHIIAKHTLVKPKSPMVQRARAAEVNEAKQVLKDVAKDYSPKSMMQRLGDAASGQQKQYLKRYGKMIRNL